MSTFECKAWAEALLIRGSYPTSGEEQQQVGSMGRNPMLAGPTLRFVRQDDSFKTDREEHIEKTAPGGPSARAVMAGITMRRAMPRPSHKQQLFAKGECPFYVPRDKSDKYWQEANT